MRLEYVEQVNGSVWFYDADDDAPVCHFVQGYAEASRLALSILDALRRLEEIEAPRAEPATPAAVPPRGAPHREGA